MFRPALRHTSACWLKPQCHAQQTKWQSQSASSQHSPVRMDTINPNVLHLRYGMMLAPFQEMRRMRQEKEAGRKLPFDQFILCDAGDPQRMGQKPLTFVRQLLAACSLPSLINGTYLPADVEKKARTFLQNCDGRTIGAYGWYTGYDFVRKEVARFIEKRDGYETNWRNLFITTGASDGMHIIYRMLSHYNGRIGVLQPVPGFPKYNVCATVNNLHEIVYYLNEDNHWSLDISELNRAVTQNRSRCTPRALVVINPGNPTGQLLTEANIREVIKFAHEHNLLILADEVYQENVYGDAKFVSFRKVLMDLGKPYSDKVQIASVHSLSKGFFGECGLRIGYLEFTNFPTDVIAKLENNLYVPPVTGQTLLYAMANPPLPGEPSYELWVKERTEIHNSLSKKALACAETLNSTPGMSCNRVDGAMYAFPRLQLPEKFIQEARKLNREPDEHFCAELVIHSGVSTIPGCGFLQQPGTHHLRITILPPEDLMKKALDAIKAYSREVYSRYS